MANVMKAILFSSFRAYTISDSGSRTFSHDRLSKAFEKFPPKDPKGDSLDAFGFAPLLFFRDQLVAEPSQGVLLFQVRHAKRRVSSSKVKVRFKEAMRDLMAKDVKISKQLKKDTKDAIVRDLLKEAVVEEEYVNCLVASRYLMIGNSSAVICDHVQNLLVDALQSGIGLDTIGNEFTDISKSLTKMVTDRPPKLISLSDRVKVKDSQKSTVAFAAYDVQDDQVLEHISDGFVVNTIRLISNDLLSFTLTNKYTFSAISPTKQLQEELNTELGKGDESDAHIASGTAIIIANELVKMLDSVTEFVAQFAPKAADSLVDDMSVFESEF